MTVFNPNRRRNARGEQREQELLRAAAAVFRRLGYHHATTNAIALEAGVSPATVYQFFPNKEAIANALAAQYAREMASAERTLDPEFSLSFHDAMHKLIATCIRYNREHPEFHTLVVEAPLSDAARNEKQALGQTFVTFIAERLRRETPSLSRTESLHHGRVALMIFHGILDRLVTVSRSARPRLQQAMHEAILRYLEPVLTLAPATPLRKRNRLSKRSNSASRHP